MLAAINTFQNHPSDVNIKQREFNIFNNTNKNVVRKTIKNLNVRKTYQGYLAVLLSALNYWIRIGEFPNEPKHADGMPVHKKGQM